jgi:purine-binding chemotaxis protein CheW
MDFLKIRRKAKEQAAAGKRSARDPAARPARKAGRRAAAFAGEDLPVLAAPETGGGTPAARPRGGSEQPAPTEGADARFTTWRPGSGERPFVPSPEPAPAPTPAPSDFAVFDPTHERALAEVAPALVAHVSVPILRDRPAAEPGREIRAGGPAPARRATEGVRDALDDFFFRGDEDVPALVALPTDPEAAPAGVAEDAGVEEYLTFRLGAEEYAVAIEHVREVLKSQAITEVPRAPAGVLGVVSVRGEVVAVFDPRTRLGLPGPAPADGAGRIVIVDAGEGPSGLLVDSVASVVRLAHGSVEPCPQGIGGASADCLAGIGRERSRLFMVLDLAALLRRGQAQARGGRAAHAER